MATTVGAPARTDGRATRWETHRRARRDELVDAALRAVVALGPDVAMDDIAAEAGTSKTVLYRHFADKDALHAAVAARVDHTVVAALRAAVRGAGSSRQALAAAITTYLHLVAADPHVYRFVLAAPRPDSGGDPLGALTSAIGTELARLIVARTAPHAREGAYTASLAQALPWAHGIVWLVRGAADAWVVAGSPAPADDLAAQLTRLAWDGLGAVLDAPGAGPDPLAPPTPGADTVPSPLPLPLPHGQPQEQP